MKQWHSAYITLTKIIFLNGFGPSCQDEFWAFQRCAQRSSRHNNRSVLGDNLQKCRAEQLAAGSSKCRHTCLLNQASVPFSY